MASDTVWTLQRREKSFAFVGNLTTIHHLCNPLPQRLYFP